jgi:hypothetical protein
MDQIQNFADTRLVLGCIYCGADDGTREHVPSKVFLDKPYPENLPVVGACRTCNNGYSMDEEYVACLVEVVVAGTLDPNGIRRPSISKILERSPALRRRVEATMFTSPAGILFQPELGRVKRILIKLAAGHAAYDLAQVCRHEPSSIWWHPIHLLSQEQRDVFDAPDVVDLFGEIGSRGMQRLQLVEVKLESPTGEKTSQQFFLNNWVEVQPERYRYLASNEGATINIRIVVSEFLAAEVTWEL